MNNVTALQDQLILSQQILMLFAAVDVMRSSTGVKSIRSCS